MAVSLEVSGDLVEQIVVYLRKWHALEGQTGQNAGSNDTDDIHDNLEMHKGSADKSDLQGLYAGLDINEKTDISALVLIGMGEESNLQDARKRFSREDILDLDDLLEMPMAPEYMSSALARITQEEGDNVIRLDPRSGQ